MSNSIDAIRERYHKSRIPVQQQTTQEEEPSSIVSTVYEEEEDDDDEDEGSESDPDEVEDDDYSMYSSSSSIPDENINFDLVYALHTFVATVDGQASVVKGDAMTLLDDSNSYWWLVRALKTSEVGYIPAENIETPFERLARLNKHRNIEVTSLDKLQFITHQTKIDSKPKKRVKLSKKLACQVQIILTDGDRQSFYEQEFEEFDEFMPIESDSESETSIEPILPQPLSHPGPPPPPPIHQSNPPEPQGVVSGLKRLLSITKKQKPQVVQSKNEDYHVLRIFSGNINVGALFSTVAVTPEMNADQLLKLALEKFHIPLLDHSNNKSNDGIEYYLTVKSMDSDEITLTPQDKPLAIFESLSDHLTTPMPSLTYIKRLSLEQPTIKVTRVGVSKARQRAKARFGEDSFIRFALHKRIRRSIRVDGQTYLKLAYYTSHRTITRKNSLVRVDQPHERINKLVAVSTSIQISQLLLVALEKFHLDQDPSLYHMTISIHDQETLLDPGKTIDEILNDVNIVPKGTIEKLFVLRKTEVIVSSPVDDSSRFKRFLNTKPILERSNTNESATGSVLRRLDEAIQSIEHEKRQLDHQLPSKANTLSILTSQSTKLSSNLYSNEKPKKTPVRSSSLTISNDVFDTNTSNSLSNLDDLQLELARIAASHSTVVQHVT